MSVGMFAVITAWALLQSAGFMSGGEAVELTPQQDGPARRDVVVGVAPIRDTNRVRVTVSGPAKPNSRISASVVMRGANDLEDVLSASLHVELKEDRTWYTSIVVAPIVAERCRIELSIVNESPNVPRGRVSIYRIPVHDWLHEENSAAGLRMHTLPH